ncbi:eotaxin [Sardina pilchardus]|uniref:eotaxin n=1 Tax=Sardina pilchardus TaxID=27697 RepID=UPI002E0F224D
MSPRYLVTTILVCCFALTVLSARPPRPKKSACCVKYTKRPISITTIKGVTIQDSRGPCRLNAVIFHTTNTPDVCATVQHKWVKKTLEQLSARFKALSKTLKKYNMLDKKPVKPAHSTQSDAEGSTEPYEALQ